MEKRIKNCQHAPSVTDFIFNVYSRQNYWKVDSVHFNQAFVLLFLFLNQSTWCKNTFSILVGIRLFTFLAYFSNLIVYSHYFRFRLNKTMNMAIPKLSPTETLSQIMHLKCCQCDNYLFPPLRFNESKLPCGKCANEPHQYQFDDNIEN